MRTYAQLAGYPKQVHTPSSARRRGVAEGDALGQYLAHAPCSEHEDQPQPDRTPARPKGDNVTLATAPAIVGRKLKLELV
jgi:hypothetical protein